MLPPVGTALAVLVSPSRVSTGFPALFDHTAIESITTKMNVMAVKYASPVCVLDHLPR